MHLPRGLLRHTITVEPYVGAGAKGPVYGPAVTLACHLERKRKASRSSTTATRGTGDETVAYVRLDDAGELLTLEARVTVDDRVVEVVSVQRHTFPGGPAPEHVEVVTL